MSTLSTAHASAWQVVQKSGTKKQQQQQQQQQKSHPVSDDRTIRRIVLPPKPDPKIHTRVYTDNYAIDIQRNGKTILHYDLRAGVLLYDKPRDKILLVQTRWYDNPTGVAKWGIAKGLVESNENLYECAMRELLEETGIRMTINETNPFIHVNNTYYFLQLVDSTDPAMKPVYGNSTCHNYAEIEACRWVPRESILNYPINSETLRIIKRWKIAMYKFMELEERTTPVTSDTEEIVYPLVVDP